MSLLVIPSTRDAARVLHSYVCCDSVRFYTSIHISTRASNRAAIRVTLRATTRAFTRASILYSTLASSRDSIRTFGVATLCLSRACLLVPCLVTVQPSLTVELCRKVALVQFLMPPGWQRVFRSHKYKS